MGGVKLDKKIGTVNKKKISSVNNKKSSKTTVENEDVKNTKKPRQWKYLKFEKIVRDGNVKTIRTSGGDMVYDILPKQDKIFHLKKKLIEEAMEVFDAKDEIEFADELGDVLDVLKELIRTAKIRRYNIWKAQRKKSKYRGKFKKGIYCHYVKLPQGLNEKWMEKYEDITDKIEQQQKKVKRK